MSTYDDEMISSIQQNIEQLKLYQRMAGVWPELHKYDAELTTGLTKCVLWLRAHERGEATLTTYSAAFFVSSNAICQFADELHNPDNRYTGDIQEARQAIEIAQARAALAERRAV